ncbi:MAG: hypothetical protein V4713_13190 [Pseudomonadota bacterium]
MVSAARMIRWFGIGVLLMGYPVLAHYTNVNVQNGKLGAVVAVAPVFFFSLVYALKSSPRWMWLTLFAMTVTAGGFCWTWLEQHFGALYWIQDVGMQCVLFMTFARTLVAGRKPLCIYFAEMAYGDITPQHVKYAHLVTWVWTVFFGFMALLSTLLFFLAPLTVWSVFANFLTLPLIGLLFVLEYGVRRTLLPETSQSSLSDMIRLWKNKNNPVNSRPHAELNA